MFLNTVHHSANHGECVLDVLTTRCWKRRCGRLSLKGRQLVVSQPSIAPVASKLCLLRYIMDEGPDLVLERGVINRVRDAPNCKIVMTAGLNRVCDSAEM